MTERMKKWTNTFQLIKNKDIWWKEDRLIVARDNDLRRGVISLYHDTPSAGHPGIGNTYKIAMKDFWWPNMKQDVTIGVWTASACLLTGYDYSTPKVSFHSSH